MAYFRTYTEFLSSSLSDDDISDTPDKWRGLIVDFNGPGVDVTKLLEIFPEISWVGAGLVGCSNLWKNER